MAKFIGVTTAPGVPRFRRGGIAFYADQEVVIALEDLSDAQIAAIKGEPDTLVVREFSDDERAEPAEPEMRGARKRK